MTPCNTPLILTLCAYVYLLKYGISDRAINSTTESADQNKQQCIVCLYFISVLYLVTQN